MMQLPKVTTFYPKDRPDIVTQLENLSFVETDPLFENYKNINWYNFDVISVYDEADVKGFSVAWHRPKWYSPDTIRIVSKYWKSPSIRLQDTLTVLANNHIQDMVLDQMKLCKQLGYTKAFISREKSPQYFKKLINNIAEKTNTQWKLYADKQCICNPDEPSCWQYKAEVLL